MHSVLFFKLFIYFLFYFLFIYFIYLFIYFFFFFFFWGGGGILRKDLFVRETVKSPYKAWLLMC